MRTGERAERRSSQRPSRALPVLLAAAWGLGGCALLPPITGPGEAINLALAGDLAYVALGEAGLGVFDVSARRMVAVLPPEDGAGSVDDLALADGLLFVLDARAPGHVTSYALADARRPARASRALPVPVEPFSGVSAALGRVVVSGGTKPLTVAAYGPDGALSPGTATVELGRGQPDVLLAPGGAIAFVSTHFSLLRSTYGITALALAAPPEAPRPLGRLELEGAGFTPGAAKPANFALETALDGTTLLVASGAGLSVVSVADSSRPRLLATLPLGLRAVNVDAAGGLAAVVGSEPSPTLVLVDVRIPSAPVVVATLPLPAGSLPSAVALDARRVVVAARGAGVIVIER